MQPRISRRNSLFVLTASASALAASPAPEKEPSSPVNEAFPSHPPELIRETVTVAHGNFKRLKEIVDGKPALAKAAIDWGFGDWEDCLGAASHVGNREIAEYLIAKGARPTLFSATMLGQIDVVKAFVAAQPGCQRIPGPHSISLLAHAKNGGAPAEPVLRYLESLGDAGTPTPAPISAEQTAALAGTYTFGAGPRDTVEISVTRGQLMFTRKGATSRGLVHVGDLAFHPAGASAVRIRFTLNPPGPVTLAVHDPDPVLLAKKL